MATRQQLEQQLVAAHRSGNVQAAQQAAYNIRAYDTAIARGGSGFDWNVPSINAPPPIERVPKPTFGDYFEDISRGMGRGFVTQLEGMQQLVTHPYDTGKALIQAGVEAVRNPAQAIGEAWSGIKSQAQTAMSSPEGFGRVLGENLDFIPGPGGKGTRNIVVFPGEEQNLTILERDGVKAEVPKPDELAYHGTTKQAAAAIEREGFDLTRAADGTVWFTSNPNIGEVAATGKGGIVARSVSGLKLGGWDEMDKYSTDELIAKGYDGLRLKDGDEITYQIFNPEKLKVPTKKAK